MLARLDTRQEAQAPLQSGPVKMVLYAMFRLTDWTKGSDSIFPTGSPPADQVIGGSSSTTGGGAVRVMGAGGINSSMTFSRPFNDVESRFWDIHRIMHIIKPVFNLHLAGSSIERSETLPLDPSVEGAHGASAANFGIHQLWQTKRGGPGNWRNVDWMRLDLDFTAFFAKPSQTFFEPEFSRPPLTKLASLDSPFPRGQYFTDRPENSLAMSTANWYYEWRASDTLTLMSDGNYGENGLDRANIGAAVQRSPRWRFYFGDRYIRALDTNELVFQSHYKLNRKYDMLFSYAFDTIRAQTSSTQVTLVRKFDQFYAGLTFELSNASDPQNQGGRQMVMLSFWPAGVPEMTIGDSRYSQPGTTTDSTKGY